jgi:hypothetical protein
MGKYDFLPSTDSIINWLGRFHTYYQNKLNIVNGENYHTLYNREVAVHGENILNYLDRIKDISLYSKSIGYGYSITLDIKEITSNFDKIELLIKDEVITSLGVIIDENEENIQNYSSSHKYALTLSRISEFKVSIGLITRMETLYKLGTLELPNFNSLSFTIYPINNEPNQFFNEDPITSCSRHLRILINDDGLIYSCLGLFGLEEFSIGSIYTPLEETLFDVGNSKLNFEELIKSGPKINTENLRTQKRITGLPQMCELHRINLTEQ